MRILVTGAGGFVGSLLAPRLLEEGHHVRALARNPARAHAALAPHPLEVVTGDALTGAGLARALQGVEVAYYLIHSLESPPSERPPSGPHTPAGGGEPFWERDLLAAHTFAAAAQRARVQRIVYLGGLLPDQGRAPVSRHLESRAQVEEILLRAVPNSVALRASIVIGSRSRSFRLLVRLLERLPVLALPRWRRFRTQPIDARDVVELLARAASVAEVGGHSLDVGGPEALTYKQLLERIAELMLLHRPTLALGVTMTPLTARLAAILAAEDPELVLALMEGLESDLLPNPDHHTAELLGVQLHSFDAAVECALREWEAVEPLAAR